MEKSGGPASEEQVRLHQFGDPNLRGAIPLDLSGAEVDTNIQHDINIK